MSLSINTPAFVNVDNGHLDQPLHTPATLNLPSAAQTHTDNTFHPPKGEVTVDAGTLNKLFDMLELVFKALREMFAGKQSKSSVLPDKADAPVTELEVGKLPPSVKANELLAVKGELPKQQSVPLTSLQNKPDSTGTTDAALVGMPALVRDTPKHSPGLIALPVTESDTIESHDHHTTDLPVTRWSTLRPQLNAVLPAAPKPEVTVTNDAKANVNVNVNIDHCHCPETGLPLNNGLTSRVLPDVRLVPAPPHVDVTSETTPPIEPQITPKRAQELPLTVTPEVGLHTEDDVKRDPALIVTPETPPVDYQVTPQPDVEVTSEHQPDEPPLDVTSPGPAEDYVDQEEGHFKARSNFNF
ncbi:hypothetical protein [Pseudomonas antarctica]|uniref:hypothetical protein n=1 Tax=Pseudomonas antarctica TaxID=219572 RepID=UPI003F74CA8C